MKALHLAVKTVQTQTGSVEAYQLMSHGVENYSRETFLGALDLGRQALVELGTFKEMHHAI